MRLAPALCIAVTIAALPALAAEETKVVKPDGQAVTVRSDEAGTTVINDGKTQGAEVTPMEKQHQERVQELTKDGGVVVEQKNTQR